MPEPTAPDGVAIEAYDGEISHTQIDRLNTLINSGPFEVHVKTPFQNRFAELGTRFIK